ncbi:MAG TPA: hypothetical protein VNT79_05295 [Phycisphaerae bacterium]|nr:hypothetical protein [Phycisphaerae bacterium]
MTEARHTPAGDGRDVPVPERAGAKYALAGVVVLLVVLFLSYLWWVSRVLPHIEKFPNGQVKATGYVKREGGKYVRTGHWVTFHENGQKASEGRYDGGRKVPGTWQYWDAAGVLMPEGLATTQADGV